MSEKTINPEKKIKHQNRLAQAASPYLLAHADNPVDWYEWGEEAFERARREDKPIFLSIGYNACHWCHVMEHESFENEEIAALLNDNFISIKVDREERPDIDQIYMSAVTALTGSGGWPMSVFLTPDRKPFFAGTYFPPDDRYGRPGFKKVITELARAYREQRQEIVKSSQAVYDHLANTSTISVPGRAIDKQVLLSAGQMMLSNFDNRFGGFGGAPKFPHSLDISLLFRIYDMTGDVNYRDAGLFSLRKMAEGGIYDQLGGGFHRYAVDEKWLVPHFEKMLYDNALLVIPYLEAFQITSDSFYLDIVKGTLGYLQNQMTDASGGFYSSQDADSEGEEGLYYTWTANEIDDILGAEAEWFKAYFGVTAEGNFEQGRSILNIGRHSVEARKNVNLYDEDFTQKLTGLKNQLMEVRNNRIAPATDDKILASWNGLAISAFAQAYLTTGNRSYQTSAKNAADFILSHMMDDERLFHSWRQGRLVRIELLEDYAYFSAGLIDLYRASENDEYLRRSEQLARRAVDIFADDKVFYSTAVGQDDLIIRPRELTDNATPAAGSVMISNLQSLADITGREYFAKQADGFLAEVSGLAAQAPQGSATLLLAGYKTLG